MDAAHLLFEVSVFGLETFDDHIFLVHFFSHAFDHLFKLPDPLLKLGIDILLLRPGLFDVELTQGDRFDRGAPPVGRVLVFLAGRARLALFLGRFLGR